MILHACVIVSKWTLILCIPNTLIKPFKRWKNTNMHSSDMSFVDFMYLDMMGIPRVSKFWFSPKLLLLPLDISSITAKCGSLQSVSYVLQRIMKVTLRRKKRMIITNWLGGIPKCPDLTYVFYIAHFISSALTSPSLSFFIIIIFSEKKEALHFYVAHMRWSGRKWIRRVCMVCLVIDMGHYRSRILECSLLNNPTSNFTCLSFQKETLFSPCYSFLRFLVQHRDRSGWQLLSKLWEGCP